MSGHYGNFNNNDHAYLTGLLIGELRRRGVPAAPVADVDGNWTPAFTIQLDENWFEPVELQLMVLPPGSDKLTKGHEGTTTTDS